MQPPFLTPLLGHSTSLSGNTSNSVSKLLQPSMLLLFCFHSQRPSLRLHPLSPRPLPSPSRASPIPFPRLVLGAWPAPGPAVRSSRSVTVGLAISGAGLKSQCRHPLAVRLWRDLNLWASPSPMERRTTAELCHPRLTVRRTVHGGDTGLCLLPEHPGLPQGEDSESCLIGSEPHRMGCEAKAWCKWGWPLTFCFPVNNQRDHLMPREKQGPG